MRQTVVIVSPYGVEYGPPRTLEHVARATAQAGFEPLCVVPPNATITRGLAALDPPLVDVKELATVPRTLNPLRLTSFLGAHLSAARTIAELAAERRARLIYSISEATFCGGLAARRLGIPSLVHVIGMSIQSPRWAARTYIPLLGRLTDEFVACSSAVADMLAEHGVPDSRISVVHNGIPTGEVEASASLASPLDGPGCRVGMIAAYDVRKGHELFVRAAALVSRARPDARFYLIGGRLEGQHESAAFEARIVRLVRELGLEDRFERPGYVPRPDVYGWIRAMDVVVVPSETEAFAHVLIEAMACGRAVVATAIEGNVDAFVDRHSGRFAAKTPESIAAAVTELLDDPGQRERLGAAARDRVRLLFDTDVTLPALGQAVLDLIGRRRPPA